MNNIENLERFKSKGKRLSERMSQHQQLKKKSVTTALSAVLASVYTQQPNSEPHGATRQQAIAKTHAKLASYKLLLTSYVAR
jgi:hypothetical protein